jgi:mitogen-activated protein kinase kinase kinase
MKHPTSRYLSARSVDQPEIELWRKEDNDDSDDSDFGTSLWKRPPADLTAGRLKDGLSRTASSRSSQIRKAIFRPSTHHEHDAPWAPRPVPEEVYDHLQEFFPHHDLDKAIIEVGHADSTAEPKASDDRRRQAKKSIRMVAEEQINRNQIGMRRKTKLWDSNVKELRT